jgi:hypothetical protein
MLKIHGTASLSDFLDDLIVYRSLVPCDQRLPTIDTLRSKLGFRAAALPRKTEPDYARAVAEMLRAADRLRGGHGRIAALVMIGDTEHNDGMAFQNLCRALDVPGAAFICDEHDGPAALEPRQPRTSTIFLATRWRLLEAFDRLLRADSLGVTDTTAVVIDVDKTALGARGRNHTAIDAARFDAVTGTAAGLLGSEVDLEAATDAYRHLNRPRFHLFTTDNQDYLAYLCLLIGAGWIRLHELSEGVSSGRWSTFGDLLSEVSAAETELPPGLAATHRQVTAAVTAGDPTPFKRFRRAEYLETVARMDPQAAAGDPVHVLGDRITITHEVLHWALEWQGRGALLFGLSDKPDEASLPTEELAREGYRPLHRTPALVVGDDGETAGE